MLKINKMFILIIPFLLIPYLSFAGDTCDPNTREVNEGQVIFLNT